MTQITAEQMLEVRSKRGHLLFGTDLAEQAALESARYLAEHWEDAMECGESLPHMVSDVDEVIEILKLWKQALEHTFCNV